jgi:hypothetical protein
MIKKKQLKSLLMFLDKGSRLLVGTNEGILLDYDVRDGTGNEPFSVNLLASRKNFSKKPIEQLHVIESLSVLLCLTGLNISSFSFGVLSSCDFLVSGWMNIIVMCNISWIFAAS